MSGPQFTLVTDGSPDAPLCFTCSWCPADDQGTPVKVLGTDLDSHAEWVHHSGTFSAHTSSRRLYGEQR